MKFLCSHCESLSEVSKFRVEALTLIVTCSRCGVENQSTPEPRTNESALHLAKPLTEPSRPAPMREPGRAIADGEFIVPKGHCPKCLSRRASGTACPSCGLPANADGSDFEPSTWLKTEWISLASYWNDSSRHQSVRQEAFVKRELAGLGRLYRLKLAQSPDDAIAQRGRDEVVHMAMVSSLAAEKTPPPKISLTQSRLVGALVAACLVFLMFLLSKMFRA